MTKILHTLFLLTISFSIYAETEQELFLAAIQGKESRIQNMLAQGMDVNSTVNGNRTALMAAAHNGNYKTIQLLITYGADINLSDKQGVTALMDAVSFGDEKIVQLLINAGADINAKDAKNNSVLDRAKKTQYKHLIAILDPNSEGKEESQAKPEEAEGEETSE